MTPCKKKKGMWKLVVCERHIVASMWEWDEMESCVHVSSKARFIYRASERNAS